MTYQTIQIETTDAIATVWLNRPEVRNAFNDTAIAEITDAFRSLDDDPNVRVIVLAARGPVFCAGADLNWMKKMAGYTYEENRVDAARLADMLKAIYFCRKPTIAKVQGDCYAGGMGLVSACDVAVAVDSANFCLSEVKIGLIPATIAPYVIQAMGQRAAQRYFVTAERFSATEGRRIGFVHESVSSYSLDAKVNEIITNLLSASPNAVAAAKLLVHDVAAKPIDEELINDTVDLIASIRASDEGKEGVKAFLEKRKPAWIQSAALL
jgi:methylglutaconyl-CoA hydratase